MPPEQERAAERDAAVPAQPAYPVEFTVNGQPTTTEVPADRRLVDFLREDLGLTGTKIGCEVGFCGLCSVVLNGRPVSSCHTLAVQADGGEVVTVEGLGDDERVRALRQAFADEGAFQCGFCTSGQLVMASCVVRRDDAQQLPPEEVARAMALTLCRCTGYYGIRRAIEKAIR